MRAVWIATLLLSFPVLAVDTHDCQYWLKMLDEVARIEYALIYSVPAIAKQENVYSAMDLQLDLQELLARLRKKMEKDVKQGDK